MAKTLEIDWSEAKKARRDLETFAKRALPHAMRNSLNSAAFEGRKLWLKEIDRKFITRNKFTAKSVRVEKAHGINPKLMHATLGSVAPYMRTQEEGGQVRGSSGGSKPIPTSSAAGQGKGTFPRTRAVRRANYLKAIRLHRGRRGGSKRQRNATALSQAVRTGRRFALLALDGGRKGLFRVTGKKRLSVRMLWDLSRPSVRVPATPTLQNTLDALAPRMPSIHLESLKQQMLRNGVYWRIKRLG